jgi:2-polyprenyl-6-methoxyphenol hydroxylase-like FAD-dependent oxidoreductase
MSYYTVPPEEGDTPDATWTHFPGRRNIMTRRDRPDCLRVYMGYGGDDEGIIGRLRSGSMAEQKAAWADVFGDVRDAWRVPRFLDGLHSAEAEDFYSVEFAQVKLDSWSEGRVVLLGDAGFCPSPLTGMGTSLALAGAYVLAGEIGRACLKAHEEGGNPWDGIPAGLAAYETTLRPFVQHVQDVPIKRILSLMLPKSAGAIRLLHWVFWLFTALRLDRLAGKFASDDRGTWKLPEYPELSGSKEG